MEGRLKRNIILAGKKNRYMKRVETMLKKEGYNIISGAEETDILIFCIDPDECSKNDYSCLLHNYQLYGLGLLCTINTYLPLFKENSLKRLCFLTTLHSSINHVSEADHWERIVAASCNMAIRILFNRLNKEGFTFRVFGVNDFAKDSVSYAIEYFMQDRSFEVESDLHSDERRLVIRDKYEHEYAW